MDLFLVLGTVGSVASIIGVFLPASSKRQRFVHVLYGLLVTALAAAAIYYQQRLARVNQVERAALELVDSRARNFTSEGFVHASLAFLEKNKDLYPDSYARAQELCRHHNCLSPQHAEGTNSLAHAWNMNSLAFAMEGFLRGIAHISKGS